MEIPVPRQLFVLLLTGAAACSEPGAPAQPIVGDVRLVDELGNRLPSAGGVRVRIGDAQGAPGATSFTDDGGHFVLDTPLAGSFRVVLDRDGFATTSLADVPAGAVLPPVELDQRSTVLVTGAQARPVACGSASCLDLDLELDHYFLQGAQRRLLRLFLSSHGDVGPASYDVTTVLVVPDDDPGLSSTGDGRVHVETTGLTGLLEGFPPGTGVAIAVYGATENWWRRALDPAVGLETFADLSPTGARAAITVP